MSRDLIPPSTGPMTDPPAPAPILPLPIPDDMWWCGKCRSLIPRTYWHRCDEKETHSGPHDEYPR